MQKRIIECVPNFSEGRNMETIKQITDVIDAAKGVKLLDVDPGEATNRTVVTFVGEPAAVCDAAVAAIKRATELLDMRGHKGAHPRMGACDVCPLIPVSGITLEECAELARELAKRISEEVNVPTYCYEEFFYLTMASTSPRTVFCSLFKDSIVTTTLLGRQIIVSPAFEIGLCFTQI